jgi:LmbE family N-acetylglucosaminyl deacetylase
MKIAFVFSHLDDESYGPLGTIIKLSKENEVFLFSLCKGTKKNYTKRKKVFNSICEDLKVKNFIFNNYDLTLEYRKTVDDLTKKIEEIKPDVVYTHNKLDLHSDHRITSEACLVACRPKLNSTVKQFYMCEIPASTEWSFSNFEPNVYVNIEDYIEQKKKYLAMYETEIYNYPDARSVESMEDLAKYRGRQIGIKYAESFKLIFSLDQKNS